jgi:iron only hydrogenase large subunit-like protein
MENLLTAKSMALECFDILMASCMMESLYMISAQVTEDFRIQMGRYTPANSKLELISTQLEACGCCSRSCNRCCTVAKSLFLAHAFF